MKTLAFATLALIVASCGDPDPAPSVAIVEVTPESLDPAADEADDLAIVVEYHDADGDLGGGVAEVHDCRDDGLVTALAIPPIASEQAIAEGVPIEGLLELVVSDIGEISGGQLPVLCADLDVATPATGQAVFCVVLTDAAGNVGPGDCTDAIAVQ